LLHYGAGWVVKPRVHGIRQFMRISHLGENRYRKKQGKRCLNEHVTTVRMKAVATRENLIYIISMGTTATITYLISSHCAQTVTRKPTTGYLLKLS